MSFGVPFTEFDRVFFGIGVSAPSADVQDDSGYADSPILYQEYVQQFGDGYASDTTSFPLTASWARDSRNSALTPTSGQLQRANIEFAPEGTLRYYRAVYQNHITVRLPAGLPWL